ncbi:glycosyltransferase [Patescibacteria group bacterium]|nr:glycosyltransferase [Patescibacteria group bacterium]
MKVSVCGTVKNEEGSIGGLLEALLGQTKKPEEIVIVDGGSTDKTVEIIRHFQKKNGRIRLLVQKCSIAQGRNLAIELAKNDIIAMTDAGCIAHKDWLQEISEPFEYPEVDVVAGFYRMVGDTAFQKASSVFLGVLPSKFDINFLPSTRSIAFRKDIWELVGGFPENSVKTAEDTGFNFRLIKVGAKLARVKSALVEWGMPVLLGEFAKKIYEYASGDAKSKIWLFPKKGLSSHNIKALSIFARYILGIGLIIYFFSTPLFPIVWLGLVIYIFWAFRKVSVEFKDWKVGLWGIILQFVSDFAVMSGFVSGIFSR